MSLFLADMTMESHFIEFAALQRVAPRLSFLDATHSCWMSNTCAKTWGSVDAQRIQGLVFRQGMQLALPASTKSLLETRCPLLVRVELNLAVEGIAELIRSLGSCTTLLPSLRVLHVGDIEIGTSLDDIFGLDNKHMIDLLRAVSSSLQIMRFNFFTRSSHFFLFARLFDPTLEIFGAFDKISRSTYFVGIGAWRFARASAWCVLASEKNLEEPFAICSENSRNLWSLCWPKGKLTMGRNMKVETAYRALDLLSFIDTSEHWRPASAPRRLNLSELCWLNEITRDILEDAEHTGGFESCFEFQTYISPRNPRIRPPFFFFFFFFFLQF